MVGGLSAIRIRGLRLSQDIEFPASGARLYLAGILVPDATPVLQSSFAEWFQPRKLPEDQATGLTAAVTGSVTASIEVNRLIDAASTNRKNRIAGLVRPLVDLKLSAAEREHLGHERHAVELPLAVECAQDLIFASDLHPLAYF
jgi:hypothetical protein